jgi:hypothetical protein
MRRLLAAVIVEGCMQAHKCKRTGVNLDRT